MTLILFDFNRSKRNRPKAEVTAKIWINVSYNYILIHDLILYLHRLDWIKMLKIHFNYDIFVMWKY